MLQYIKDYNIAVLVFLKIFNETCFKLNLLDIAHYWNYLCARIKNLHFCIIWYKICVYIISEINLFIYSILEWIDNEWREEVLYDEIDMSK